MKNRLTIDILTLFPEMFSGVLHSSMLAKAAEKKLAEYHIVNFRDYAHNKHQQVDDYPYGGGVGMVLKPEPVFLAVDDLTRQRKTEPRIVLLCPQGEPYNQQKAEELAREDHLILICGHYEGYDERIRQHLVSDEISIGDYVLTGGEIPAMSVIDSVVRLREGVLGNKESKETDSFTTGWLEYPQYTRPAEFRGMQVPDVLLSGHHERIEQWRHKQSLYRTWTRRPDLLAGSLLSQTEKTWISEWEKNESENNDCNDRD